jgi:hypothetical protein
MDTQKQIRSINALILLTLPMICAAKDTNRDGVIDLYFEADANLVSSSSFGYQFGPRDDAREVSASGSRFSVGAFWRKAPESLTGLGVRLDYSRGNDDLTIGNAKALEYDFSSTGVALAFVWGGNSRNTTPLLESDDELPARRNDIPDETEENIEKVMRQVTDFGFEIGAGYRKLTYDVADARPLGGVPVSLGDVNGAYGYMNLQYFLTPNFYMLLRLEYGDRSPIASVGARTRANCCFESLQAINDDIQIDNMWAGLGL